MNFVLAIELFGHHLPNPGFAAIGVVFIVGAFLTNRESRYVYGRNGRSTGRGPVTQCPKCGLKFQVEQVEVLPSGDEQVFTDDRCPNCGTEAGTVDPDYRPGKFKGW